MLGKTMKSQDQKHTPGPWRAESGVTGVRAGVLVWLGGHAKSVYIRSDGVVLGGNSHQLVAIVPYGEGDAKADARRIVACVNYCDGLDGLELMKRPLELQAERDLLLAQQVELVRVLTLLAAGAISLSDCLHWEELNGFALDPKTDAAWSVTSEGIEQARAALTKLGKS